VFSTAQTSPQLLQTTSQSLTTRLPPHSKHTPKETANSSNCSGDSLPRIKSKLSKLAATRHLQKKNAFHPKPKNRKKGILREKSPIIKTMGETRRKLALGSFAAFPYAHDCFRLAE
jgi:hypothetical protein